MEARLLQQTFMGIAHMTRMTSDRWPFKQNLKNLLALQPTTMSSGDRY
jgi:hypothetical protein